MSVQSVPYGTTPDLAVAGMVADVAPRRISSVIVEAAIAAGLLVVHGTTTRTEGAPPSAVSADVDSIIASGGASAATAQTIVTTALNGVIGQGLILPPRNVTLTFSSHTDWDATTAIITGEDEEGRVTSENLSIPNGGNATVTGAVAFRKVTSVYIPAQSGTGGTFTAGTGVILGACDIIAHGVSVYDAAREPGVYAVDYAMPVIKQGVVWVESETAVNPSLPVLARFTASGDEVLGAFRATADSTDLALVRSARWLDITSGAGLARLAINLP